MYRFLDYLTRRTVAVNPISLSFALGSSFTRHAWAAHGRVRVTLLPPHESKKR